MSDESIASFLQSRAAEAHRDMEEADSPMERERHKAWRDCCEQLADIAADDGWMARERVPDLLNEIGFTDILRICPNDHCEVGVTARERCDCGADTEKAELVLVNRKELRRRRLDEGGRE